MNAARAYARTQHETASKERLMVLLFEAALKHIRAGAAALEEGKKQDAVVPLTRAGEIVSELSATLDVTRAPELGQALKDVYLFVSGRLLRAAAVGQAEAAREAERAFAPIVEAFAQVVVQQGAPPEVSR
ncbi:MAG: flagellar protein FliS [Myxococcales bacterium]|nr:flagellar protein FliS [Myxococcales bacterium]